MRTLNELYRLLWEQIKEQKILEFGLCYETAIMAKNNIISEAERDKLQSNISRIVRFKYNGLYITDYYTEEGTKQRKEFVQDRIQITIYS